jgi:hypothetical protein
MKASILALRRRMPEVLRALERNEPVTILHRGRVKGVIHPVGEEGPETPSASTHPAFGIWKDREDLEDVAGFVRKLRKARGHVD